MQACPSCGEENPDKFRMCGYCGAALAAAVRPQEERRVVTVFFSDLKGSTNLGEALDPEALREVMGRYFDAMTAIIVKHGGAVEKFIGDAIMAVFGLRRIHEDDALRAVRAALETRTALTALNDQLDAKYGVRLTVRTGVNTGEVVAGNPVSGQRLVTGDAVNVAARLEQAAPPNEILIGELTHRLVRDAVSVEPVEPLDLKGKSERVSAFRLVDVHEPSRGPAGSDLPLVGREAEVRALVDVVEAAARDGRAQLATIIGDPGVGKSRLVAELVGRLDGRVLVLRGHCLSYGDGITFWPLAEIARQAAAIDPADSPDTAVAKLRDLAEDADVADRLAAAIGLTSEPFAVGEISWAARQLLERLARDRPVVAIVDDIHWAEENFLALIDHVVDEAESPVVVLCTARHELVDANPSWGEGERRTRVVLDRLDGAAVGSMLEALLGEARLPPHLTHQVVEAADGNPLFVEQLVSMLLERDLLQREHGGWVPTAAMADFEMPPSIHALVAARLDMLDAAERVVVGPAAVIGTLFPSDAVRALVVETVRSAVDEHLGAMVRKRLVRPNADRHDEQDYRFDHVLIREAAYRALLKRTRAELHESYVTWADALARERERESEHEEISAYHLEQAYRYLGSLGPLDDHGVELGRRASVRLSSAGSRAFARGDMPAAVTFLRRASETLESADPARVPILTDLAEALMETGSFTDALAAADEAASLADVAQLPAGSAHATLVRLLIERYAGEEPSWGDRARQAAERSMSVFRATGDPHGEIKAWRILAWVHGQAGEYDAAAAAAEQVIELSRRVADTRQEARGAISYAMAALYGPTPIPEAIERCVAIAASVESDRRTHGHVLSRLAELRARDGAFDEARADYRQAAAQLRDLGSAFHAATTSLNSWRVELLAGDLDAAEAELRSAQELLSEMGEQYHLSTVTAALGRVHLLKGDAATAEELAVRAAQMASEDDVVSQTLSRGVRARARTALGAPDEGVTLAREAVAIIGATQDLLLQTEALTDLAEALRAAGEDAEAEQALDRAIDLATAKHDRVVLDSLLASRAGYARTAEAPAGDEVRPATAEGAAS